MRQMSDHREAGETANGKLFPDRWEPMLRYFLRHDTKCPVGFWSEAIHGV